MAPQVIAAIIGVSSALIGTLIGGFISYWSNRNIKLEEWQLSLIKEEINSRKKLYSEFLGEANRLLLFSLEEKVSSIREIDSIISYFTQIELVATEKVIERAKSLVDCVITCNTQSAKKEDQNFYDLKKYFIEAVKDELFEMSLAASGEREAIAVRSRLWMGDRTATLKSMHSTVRDRL